MTDAPPMTRAEKIAANKALTPQIDYTGMQTMFYRRKAKRSMYVPSTINGQVVIKGHSRAWLKWEFNPDHVKARLFKRALRGIGTALSWVGFTKLAKADQKPKAKPAVYFQPNTPRAAAGPCRKKIRPRTVRRIAQRAEQELAASRLLEN